MKILHTSDWHLGRTLYGRRRYEEFESFLAWLAETMEQEQTEALLVAGDVFDVGAPSNRAQELYYRFLCRVASSSCRHVVAVAGNHDSPSFLGAPRELLKALNVHVVGSAGTGWDEEVLVLRNAGGRPELIVCAVPYLRDRDIRTVEAGESMEDKERKQAEGIRSHYAHAAALAEQKRRELGANVPIVAMGHLFAAGGQTGEGVRDLSVGSLAHVAADVFPSSLDYVALGHLHVPQRVNGSEAMRYSGSPLPMGFGETGQQKSVCLVEFVDARPEVRLVDVPLFQRLEQIRGNWDELAAKIRKLAAAGDQAWLEVVYEGDEVIGDLRERLEEAVAGSGLEILRVRNNRIVSQVLQRMEAEENLSDLGSDEVFARCLAASKVPDEQRPELLQAYREIRESLSEENGREELGGSQCESCKCDSAI